MARSVAAAEERTDGVPRSDCEADKAKRYDEATIEVAMAREW